MNKEIEVISEKNIRDRIYIVRGKRVMIDSDLAAIYGYDIKNFNRKVKNNRERFDEDFMFRLTDEEFEILRCKNCTSSWGGRRYNPYAFTDLFQKKKCWQCQQNYIIMGYCSDKRILAKEYIIIGI